MILNPIKLTIKINHRCTPVVFKSEDGKSSVPKHYYGPSHFTATHIQHKGRTLDVRYILLDDLMNNFKALLPKCVLRGKQGGGIYWVLNTPLVLHTLFIKFRLQTTESL